MYETLQENVPQQALPTIIKCASILGRSSVPRQMPVLLYGKRFPKVPYTFGLMFGLDIICVKMNIEVEPDVYKHGKAVLVLSCLLF